MLGKIAEKIALVTGGTRGIGKAIALALKDAKYQVLAAYHHNHHAAAEFSDTYNIPSVSMDVSDFASCADRIATLTKQYGPISVLVNNAGITRDGMLHKMTDEMWMEVTQTNLNSCFNVCRAVIEGMRQEQFGRIINISSVNALKGQLGQTNYAAAKAGIIGFTKSLALETAKYDITVNAIAPGYIATEMLNLVPEEVLAQIVSSIPKQRLGSAEEVALVAKFLAADDASYITGQTISINGGLYM